MSGKKVQMDKKSEIKDIQSFYDKFLFRLKNNKLSAIIILVFVLIGSIATFTNSVNSLLQTLGIIKHNDGLETIQRQKQVLTELLSPMVILLDRAQAAFERWTEKNLYLESEIIHKCNIGVRDLLIEKAALIPIDLKLDANKLIVHYDRWLEEYHRIRGGSKPDLNEPFVFTGPKGYPFPLESANRFRERYKQYYRVVYSQDGDTLYRRSE